MRAPCNWKQMLEKQRIILFPLCPDEHTLVFHYCAPPSFFSFLPQCSWTIHLQREMTQFILICWVGLVKMCQRTTTCHATAHLVPEARVFKLCRSSVVFRLRSEDLEGFLGMHNSRSTVLSVFAVFEFFNSWLLLLHIWCEKLGQNLKNIRPHDSWGSL